MELRTTTNQPSSTVSIGEATRERAEGLKTRLIVAAIFSTPVMVLSMVPAWQFPGWQWVVAACAMPVVVWAAWPFHAAAFRAARHGSSTMDTLVSLGVIASTLWSLWALFFGGAGYIGMRMNMTILPRNASTSSAELYFEAAAMVTTFLLAGRYAEARTRYRAGDALRSLLELGAKQAHRVKPEGGVELVDVKDLHVDDRVVVKPGEKIPTDGVVESGHAALDTSLLTGESIPVGVGPGDEVTGATINTDGQLTVRVTRVGADTTLARIGQMVTQAQAGKAPVQRLADKISSVFVPVVIGISLLTLVLWIAFGPGLQPAFTAAVAVLVIACPCALGLATPTALLVGSGRAAQLGIVIKGPEILESTRQVDTIVLDKTGTVTKAQMRVSHAEGDTATLAAAAAVETGSSHPVAQAIVEAIDTTDSATAFINHAGDGVSATVGANRVFVGKPRWIESLGFSLEPVANSIERGLDTGATVSVVATAPLSQVTSLNDTSSSPSSASTDDTASSTDNDNASTPSDTAQWAVDLAVGGMTCASCVRRVERKLSKLPGVRAEVNLATEGAHVLLDSDISNDELISVVEKAGYSASIRGRHELTHHDTTADADAPHVTEQSVSRSASERWGNPRVDSGVASGVFWVSDEIKETSSEAIAQLRDLDITPVLLTGDNERAARYVGERVGICDVRADVLPDEKRDVITALQGEGKVVAMVGDGVNDAAALAQAGTHGLGMAMGSGTDVAIEAADITLVGSDLRSAAQAIRISRQTLKIIKQNLFWAFAYNVAAIPLAMLGLLNPMIAGAAMAASSVMVVTNSLRLRSAQ
ncbi:MAG: heavy metal translocating P-type ATPase [Actinomycetaceae bacterium]|nr:heavy metal translocating P-type ATPase [Actinomycetaceae bacterium]